MELPGGFLPLLGLTLVRRVALGVALTGRHVAVEGCGHLLGVSLTERVRPHPLFIQSTSQLAVDSEIV